MNWSGIRPRLVSAGIWATILLCLYAGLCAAMFLSQESFVFFPDRTLEGTPADAGWPFEEVSLVAPDGIALSAWWVPAPEPRGALLFCHGNAGNISHRLEKIGFFRGLGLSVLIFDYRGYGRSLGAPSEEGTYLDAEAALAHLVSRGDAPPERVILFGESLGGAVAVETALRHPCAGMAIESSFTSLRAMARHHYPWLPARWLLRMRYDSLAKVARISCPKLILHGPQDEIVPYSMGLDLFDAASAPKRFGVLAGGHNDGGLPESPDARAAFAEFLRDAVP